MACRRQPRRQPRQPLPRPGAPWASRSANLSLTRKLSPRRNYFYREDATSILGCRWWVRGSSYQIRTNQPHLAPHHRHPALWFLEVSRSGGDCRDWPFTAIPPTATTQTGVLLNVYTASQIDRHLGAEGAVALPASQCVSFGVVVHVHHLCGFRDNKINCIDHRDLTLRLQTPDVCSKRNL